VVCAGGAVVDLKLHLRAGAVLATSNPATASTTFGGVARNVAENLVVLDRPVELVSAVGDDASGVALLEHARRRGIGVKHVRVLPGRASAQYVAVLGPGGELTIGAAAMDILDEVDIASLDAALRAPGVEWLFCDTNLSGVVLTHALGRGRVAGLPIAVDAVSTAKVRKLPADLSGLALLCCNRDEARAWGALHGIADGGDDAQLASRLLAAGARSVLLSRGADGVLLADSAGVQVVPAVPAVPVDVTGAGDALVAGVLAALLDGASLVEAARAGTQRAARTVESPFSVLPA
jgi:pseudouridine kinase